MYLPHVLFLILHASTHVVEARAPAILGAADTGVAAAANTNEDTATATAMRLAKRERLLWVVVEIPNAVTYDEHTLSRDGFITVPMICTRFHYYAGYGFEDLMPRRSSPVIINGYQKHA
jgi:hypothetical protein